VEIPVLAVLHGEHDGARGRAGVRVGGKGSFVVTVCF
jgi:hypothetical protein